MLSFEDDTPIAPTLGLQTIRIGSSAAPREEGRVASQPPVSFTDVEARFTRVRAEDKRVINAKTDVNQLVPFKYKWAWDREFSGRNDLLAWPEQTMLNGELRRAEPGG
jgi:ribonucleoside-diphosphate reductase beta chain